jgi:hypothetical protein
LSSLRGPAGALIAAALIALSATAWLMQPADEGRDAPAPAASPLPVPAPPRPAATSVADAATDVPTGTATAAAGQEPAHAEDQPVQPAAADPAPRGADGPAGEPTLFITIVGDQTYYHWGRAGDRPPRIDPITGDPGREAVPEVVAVEVDMPATETLAATIDDGEVENPYGPPPQECPATLPAGSSQADADALRDSSRCRYLSSCDGENCTWFYQGRG